MLRKLWRIFRWWLKCLWAGKVVPRKETKLFSRSYMRKAWSGRLRDLDRAVNVDHRAWQDLPSWSEKVANQRRELDLLRERRLMIAKRRAYRFE